LAARTNKNNHLERKSIHENAEPCRRESGICKKTKDAEVQELLDTFLFLSSQIK
jgi:hypothetical protein